MNRILKVIVATAALTAVAFTAEANPRGFHPAPHHPHPIHHHGGHPHCAGIVAATAVATGVVIGSLLAPRTTVVEYRPVTVWVPGYWLETKDQFGRVVSRTWIEGHYETR